MDGGSTCRRNRGQAVSKNRQTAKYQYYVVGRIGEDEGRRFEAREPREAVRVWCEAQSDEFWRGYVAPICVWTDDYHKIWSNFKRWIVDASQPPAWIIQPDPEVANGKKG